MNGLNKVLLIGNVVRDAEVVSVGEYTVLKFAVATNRKFKTRGQIKEETEFHTIERWGGESVAPYLTKGTQVYIEGRIKTEKYKGKDGQDHISFKIAADVITLLGKSSSSGSGGGRPHQDEDVVDEAPF
jgi:single-strand DNA-binding protein